MTSIEFWKYYTKKNILDIFDITYDFFADGLPEEFVEEYDVVEVILETLGHNETAKNYDKILKFTDLLKTQYPGLYQDNFQYIDVKLVRYYCFNQERDKAVAAFSNFIENPTQNFDYYCKAFDILMYYGNVDLIDKAVTTNYKTVRESDEIICGAEGDLALAKYMLILEDAYTNGTFDATKSAKALKVFGFNLPKDLFLLQGQTLLSPLPEKIDFVGNDNNFLILLQIEFQKYAKNKGVNFLISNKIWMGILEHLETELSEKEDEYDANDYFSLTLKPFEKYVSNMVGTYFSDDKLNAFTLLWGSVYVYDFLRKVSLVSEDTYQEALNVIKTLKGEVIYYYLPNLWENEFIHLWEAPDSISTTEFEQESKLFRKSFRLADKPFEDLKSEITEELDAIGAFADFIKPAESKQSSKQQFITSEAGPFIAEPKSGRNDPCPCGSGKKYKKCCGA